MKSQVRQELTATYPKISIVTPTYNSARFLDKTIQSVLDQAYPNLEYIIIDGGSDDGTCDIIKRYDDQIAYWVSEPDQGMYDALQKGFAHSTGDIIGWLNSDDIHFGWTLAYIGQLFTACPQVEWLTSHTMCAIDEHDFPLYVVQLPGYSRRGYYAAEHFQTSRTHFMVEYILQESTFWRRSLWQKSEASLDTSLKYAGDTELWLRFFQYANLYDVAIPLGQFRKHEAQITSRLQHDYQKEVQALMTRYDVRAHSPLKSQLRAIVRQYVPHRFLKYLVPIGLAQQSYRLRYDFQADKWHEQVRYY